MSYIHICTYCTYGQADRQTDRQTDGRTYRQANVHMHVGMNSSLTLSTASGSLSESLFHFEELVPPSLDSEGWGVRG